MHMAITFQSPRLHVVHQVATLQHVRFIRTQQVASEVIYIKIYSRNRDDSGKTTFWPVLFSITAAMSFPVIDGVKRRRFDREGVVQLDPSAFLTWCSEVRYGPTTTIISHLEEHLIFCPRVPLLESMINNYTHEA